MTDPYFSEIPEALRGPKETMPWDEEIPPVLWMWGLDAGKALRDIGSKELLRKRGWLVKRQGLYGTYFDFLIAEIDQVLTERQGL